MRVAHFAKYAFVRIGGMERHVGILTRALAARGIDVTVFTYDPSGSLTPSTVDGVRVEPVPSILNLSSQSLSPALIARSRKLARQHRFDILHQHWPDPFAHIAASFVPGQPAHVISWHSDIVRQRILGPVYRALAPHLLVKPDALIGATHAHLRSDQVAKFAPPDRRHVIPYNIDTKPFQPTPIILRNAAALREKYGGGPLIFSLGRHVYYKGFDVLLRAMTRVPAVLILGGDGPLTPELRNLANTLNGRIKFVGNIPEDELPAYYHASDVFCLPSVAKTEAFGLVQAEAMACKKPLVNTDLGNGVNELAPDGVCALTVPPGNEFALSDALTQIISNQALASRLGSSGYSRVTSCFTVRAMIDDMLKLYESVLKNRRPRRFA